MQRQPDHYKSLWMITTNLGGERLLCGRGGWVGQPLHQGGRRQLLGQDKCKTVRRRRRRRRRICSGCKWLFTCLISSAKAASKEGKTDVYSVELPNYFKSKSDMWLLQLAPSVNVPFLVLYHFARMPISVSSIGWHEDKHFSSNTKWVCWNVILAIV